MSGELITVREFLGVDGQPAVSGVLDHHGDLLTSYVGSNALVECLDWCWERGHHEVAIEVVQLEPESGMVR